MNNFLLQGVVKWSFEHELEKVNMAAKMFTGITSFAGPMHHHKGNIALTKSDIIIEGIDNDIDLTIPLGNLKEVYHGFDEKFPVLAAKNFGIFWQPLRIKYAISFESRFIYLIIDFNGIYTHNKEWFTTLSEILA